MTREMREVLARLELLSHGSCQAWNPATAGGERSAELPPGERNPPHVVFRERWEAARSDEERARVCSAAREELEAWTRRTAPITESFVSLDDLILERGVGWDAQSVAQLLRCNARAVRRVRLERARDELGHLLEAPAAEIAVRLAGEGLPQVAIAQRLGVSQPTVSRMLKFKRREAA